MSENFGGTWRNFIEGDPDAFNELYKQHYVGLINYGSRLSGERSQINDDIVEMFLGLWDKRSNLPEVKNVRSYLLSCLRTSILQKIRSNKIHEAKVAYLNSVNEQHESSYEEYIIKMQNDNAIKEKLAHCINKLSDRQKELLQYRFFDNISYDEIAIKCEITKRTAYNIVNSALRVLKEHLKEETKNDKNWDEAIFLPLLVLYFALT